MAPPKFRFKYFDDNNANAATPITNSFKIFAPQLIANENDTEAFEIAVIYGMYMPILLEEDGDFWKQIKNAIENGRFNPKVDKLLIDCSWEGWDFRFEEYEKLHEMFEKIGLCLNQIVLVQMCENLGQIYNQWMDENQKIEKMKITHFPGAASMSRIEMTDVLGDWETYFKRTINRFDELRYKRSRKSKFLCMNNMVKPWRTAMAINLNLLKENSALFSHAKIDETGSAWDYYELGLWLNDNENVKNLRCDFAKNSPYILDSNVGTTQDRSFTTFKFDESIFENTSISIVTESDMSSLGLARFTEKILKPFAMGHAMVLCGNHNTLARMRSLGFKTFSPFINESYDMIEDGPKRFHAILQEVKRIDTLSDAKFYDGLNSIADNIIHNMLFFYNGFNSAQSFLLLKMARSVCDEWE